ncbi:MAG: DUF1501 domain-containing protein [Proteobacteria bacterium]|nr:DUF1501 domain-containing protein [Pseudomonadota bacterium]
MSRAPTRDLRANASDGERPGVRRGRRWLLATAARSLAGVAAAPHVWIPRSLYAQSSMRGRLKHLLYIRLSGGFRFQVAFNARVDGRFNPFGAMQSPAPGTEWGPGRLLEQAPYLTEQAGEALRALGVKPVSEITNQLSVIPCVDHEPLAGSADGNHTTALERWYTGHVNGPAGLFTMINYGLRDRFAQAGAAGRVELPAFVLGGSGMGRGRGKYAAHRPPVLGGNGLERFRLATDRSLPGWTSALSVDLDASMRDRQHVALQRTVDAYMQTRRATKAYAEIFASELLRVRARSTQVVDNVSNRQLEEVFGDSGAARGVRLALRLFHFGSPAIYLDQGGYDMHSGERERLPERMVELNRLLSGLEWALKTMDHPAGGRYWEHTLVVLGSEFSRTARGSPFNSAEGSDHGGDLATRWMSMPFMGGAIGRPGRSLGATRPSDLEASGKIYSYRSVLKTLMDLLGCDHSEFFPADAPFDDLWL